MKNHRHKTKRVVAAAAIAALGNVKWTMLATFRWGVTTTWFLFLLAGLFVAGSLWLSWHTEAWHWFQRSGAIVVSIGAILSTRRPLRLMLNSMIESEQTIPDAHVGEAAHRLDRSELRTCICGFALVAAGTLVWAYGDLLGCLVHWDRACI